MNSKDQQLLEEAYRFIVEESGERDTSWKKSLQTTIQDTLIKLGEYTRSSDATLKEKATTLYRILQHWANLNLYGEQGSPETRKFVADQFRIQSSPVTKQEADMYEYQQFQKNT